MKMNKRKILFLCTLIILGIGVGISLIYDKWGTNQQRIKQGINQSVNQVINQNIKQSVNRNINKNFKKSIKRKTKSIKNASDLLTKYSVFKQCGVQEGQEKQEILGTIDLSSGEDLTVAVMNLIGIEEHLFFTGAKTKKPEYYDLINEVREVRKSALKRLIPKYEGEIWCISKHLLAASYRLMETGTKQLNSGNKQEAYILFDQAYKLYLMFWRINAQSLTSLSLSTSSDLPGLSDQSNLSDFSNKPDKLMLDKTNQKNSLGPNNLSPIMKNDGNYENHKNNENNGNNDNSLNTASNTNATNTAKNVPQDWVFDPSKINCCDE